MPRKKTQKKRAGRPDWSRNAASPAPPLLPVVAEPEERMTIFCACKNKEVTTDQCTLCQF